MDRFTPVAVCVTLGLDVGFNSLLEPQNSHISIVILLTCLQVAMPLCTLVFLFVLFMRTRLLQLGNFRDLYKKFRFLFLVSPVHMALLLAVRAYRIEALAKSMPWSLTWTMRGFLELYITHKLVMVLFYYICYKTLLELGDPELYFQKAAREADKFPEFCRFITAREYRSVPQIIRGAITLETLNAAVDQLNHLVVEKYELLAAEARDLSFLRVSEEALRMRKQWEGQEGVDTVSVDCFADTDLPLFPLLRGEVGQDMLQVLKHLNVILPLRSTRTYTLYANQSKDGQVQEWAKITVGHIRDARNKSAGRHGYPVVHPAPISSPAVLPPVAR
mmetsp:Transcript_7139/g.14201  ORF Transcript_7139/g.14201 Transcript_7139/m.14201 type:complete len:332 (+) Transcript_7139:269-1264(+)